ncbi:MAG TPA: DUF5916 domain-containing protein [Verrucomicrobiae bacterium]|jgi:hypothetical protein|nr:DUF5916 domain-containing protein [Verrucomicrobiae bacterium]
MVRTILVRVLAGIPAVVAALLLATPALAWVDHTQTFPAVKVATPPVLDAALTDPVWQTGFKMTGFFDYTTREPAKDETLAYVLYDEHNVYVGVHCAQAGTPLTAVQTVDHAGVSTDDNVSFNVDTAGNGSRVYQFRVNPKGIHDEYSSENARYAPTWTSVSKIFPNGDYNVMMVVPLAAIRGNSTPLQQWRFDLVRFIAQTNDEYTWAYEPTQTNVGNSQNWPFMTGIAIASRATRPRPHADVYALGSGGADRRQFQNGIGAFGDNNPRNLGIDLTYPFTNSLAFVGTLNPDFSNVEQDQTTIAPQEFQRQYNEYRPFFSQGAQYLNSLPGVNINSADMLLYTPAIGIFNHGEKIEGTLGENSIGLLNAGGNGFDDAAYGYSFAKNDGSLVAAIQGVSATTPATTDIASGYALASTNSHSGAFLLAKEQTDRGTFVTDPGQANDFTFGAGTQGASTTMLLDYKDIGAQYNPQLGYIQLNDLKGPQFFAQYNGVGHKGGFIKSYSLFQVIDRYVDHTGAPRQVDLDESANVTFKDFISLGYGDFSSELGFGGVNLPFHQQNVSFGYKDGSPAPTDASYSWGPYGSVFVQQLDYTTSETFGVYGVSLEYDGTVEKAEPYSPPGTPGLDTQWLRRVSFTRSFGKNTSLAIGLRAINGNGGYAVPGTNVALSFHERFANLDELFVDYGTPAAYQTLHRLIVKFVFHAGGGSGT